MLRKLLPAFLGVPLLLAVSVAAQDYRRNPATMASRMEDVHGIGESVAEAEALESKMWRVRSAEAPHVKDLISRGIAKEKALPALVDHSSHVRYVRHQGAYGCGMNAEAAVWDILNDMYSPPNFHPNVSVNRMIWAWRFPLNCVPADKPCDQRKPDKIPGLGTPAAAGTALTSTTFEGDPRVYYLTMDSLGSWVAELAWHRRTSNWVFSWVSHVAGAPAAAAGTALTATTYEGNPRVYYLADDRRVHELGWDKGAGKWFHNAASQVAGSYTRLDDYLYYEGCATEGSELTNSDAVQWPTEEGNHEMSNFRLDHHALAKPGEYVAAVPVTVDDLRYWLARGPLRVEIWGHSHFVALVGYDDTAKRFKFVNSWGDQWGDNGFGYVDYSKLNAEINSAQAYQHVPSKAMPCLRVKFSHTRRQDVYLWIGVENAIIKCKCIWPTGQIQDNSRNLWLTVTLPEEFDWPPTQQNRVYLDVYDSGLYGGLIEEVLTGYNGNYVASKALTGGPVPFKPGKMIRLTVS